MGPTQVSEGRILVSGLEIILVTLKKMPNAKEFLLIVVCGY